MTTQTSAQTGDQSVSDRANDVKDRAADVGGTAQDKAAEVAGTAQERAADVAGTAKDQALEVAQEAQRQARDLLGEFRGQIQQQTEAQRERLVELLREFEDELQNMVQAGGRNGTASELVRQVADRLAGVRSYLERGFEPARRRALVRTAPARRLPAGSRVRPACWPGGPPAAPRPLARPSRPAAGHVIDVRDSVNAVELRHDELHQPVDRVHERHGLHRRHDRHRLRHGRLRHVDQRLRRGRRDRRRHRLQRGLHRERHRDR